MRCCAHVMSKWPFPQRSCGPSVWLGGTDGYHKHTGAVGGGGTQNNTEIIKMND